MKKKIFISILAIAVAMVIGGAIFLKTAYVVPVLMYHSIGYDDKLTKLSVSPKAFERQMEFLSRNHYNVVGPGKLASYIEKREHIPPRTVAITFDDGYYNNYEYAYPVLKKYKIPATIFMIVEKIGKPGWLGWNEMREMSDSGLITIESHTMSHQWLPHAGDYALREELSKSKKILEDGLGKKVEFLCYPIGAYDKRVEDEVKDAGYLAAFGTNPGRFSRNDDRYAIKRIKISRTSDNLYVFWFEISGYYTWIKEHRDK